MKQYVERSMKFNLPASSIWETLENYGDIEKYAPTIKTSSIVGELQTGLGASRRCTFTDGSSLVETIIKYNEGEGYRMELSEYSFPLKYMFADIHVKPLGKQACEITMSTDFLVKAGPLGWLMGFFLMRPIMKGAFKKVMSGLAYYTQTGNAVGEELPDDTALEKLTSKV